MPANTPTVLIALLSKPFMPKNLAVEVMYLEG
jgi:hypothetical protein